jgi:hypothetical protein
MKQGATGQCVKDAEQMLYNADHVVGYPGFNQYALGSVYGGGWHADGVFGSGMYKQVQLYQANRGLDQYNESGSIGHYTWKRLCGENHGRWVYTNANCASIGG